MTATWVGTAAFLWRYPTYVDDEPGQFDWRVESVDAFIESHGHDRLRLLKAGRVVMVIVITVVLAVAFGWAVHLLGFCPAVVGFLLIGTDPFHIAHSRLLHLYGLPSSLMLLSLLAFMTHLYRGGRRLDLLVSGVAAGLT